MALPAFKTLGALRANLRDRTGFAAQGSQSGPNNNLLDNILQTSQYQLYWMFDWKYLLKTFDQPTGVGQRFYGLPADLDPMQLQNMVTEEFDGTGVDHVVNGDFHHNFLGWADASTGDGGITWNSLGYLDLNDNTTGLAIARQQLSGLDPVTEYTLSFEVRVFGTTGPKIKIGSTLGASDIFLSATSHPVGSHSFDFINDVAAPFFQIENATATVNQVVSVDNIQIRKKGEGRKAGGIWPMKEGIDWTHDDYSINNARPLRYELREQLEIWPPSDRTNYVLRYEYVKQLGEFETDDDRATIDDNILFLMALATAKGHYGQKDFNIVLGQANLLVQNLRGKNHGNRRYLRRNPEADLYSLARDDDFASLIHRNILDV